MLARILAFLLAAVNIYGIMCITLDDRSPNADLFRSYLGGVGTPLFNTAGTATCSGNSNKLLSLLNLLCNTTQTASITARDACYGCFFRAGSLPTGTPLQLQQLSQCANVYLAMTGYMMCATNLAAIANGIRPTPSLPPMPITVPATYYAFGGKMLPTLVGQQNNGGLYCYTGYCEFVQCVRRINANALIDACFMGAMANRNVSVAGDRVAIYTNVTSCILARTRCNAYNPITGEYQVRNSVTQTLFNSVQITATGDLRIIAFPAATAVAEYFCSAIRSAAGVSAQQQQQQQQQQSYQQKWLVGSNVIGVGSLAQSTWQDSVC